MGSYQGGSAPAMARQICDGFTLVSQVSLKRLSLEQMTTLEFELDKRLRDARGEIVDLMTSRPSRPETAGFRGSRARCECCGTPFSCVAPDASEYPPALTPGKRFVVIRFPGFSIPLGRTSTGEFWSS